MRERHPRLRAVASPLRQDLAAARGAAAVPEGRRPGRVRQPAALHDRGRGRRRRPRPRWCGRCCGRSGGPGRPSRTCSDTCGWRRRSRWGPTGGSSLTLLPAVGAGRWYEVLEDAVGLLERAGRAPPGRPRPRRVPAGGRDRPQGSRRRLQGAGRPGPRHEPGVRRFAPVGHGAADPGPRRAAPRHGGDLQPRGRARERDDRPTWSPGRSGAASASPGPTPGRCTAGPTGSPTTCSGWPTPPSKRPATRSTTEAIEAGLTSIVRRQAGFFAERYESLAPSQQRIVRELARSPREKVYAKAFLDAVMVANANAVTTALRTLAEQEIVRRDGRQWRLTSPFFRAWLLGHLDA